MIFVEVVLKGNSRVQFLECVMQQIDVFVASIGAQKLVHKMDVLVIELTSLLRVVYFEYPQCTHHFRAFRPIRCFGHHGRDYYLEVGADGDQSVATVVLCGV